MKVLITRAIPKEWIAVLADADCEINVYKDAAGLSQEKLIALAKKNDLVLSIGGNKLDDHFFGQCKHLKGVSLMSVGYDNVDIDSATKYKIPVSNTPGVLSKATSDVAFLLMLAVSRDAFNVHKNIEKGEWKFFNPIANLGQELYGKTLGVFGLGRIGMELAIKAKAAYQMEIIYHNRTRNSEAENTLGAKHVSFDELLANSDVLSLHANLSTETKNIFDWNAFAKMKSSSIFINTARGGLHDEQDLIAALEQKIIWGAGLDVTNPEPMQPDNPLLNMPHVCVLPHIGSATEETRKQMALTAAGNILSALNNKQMAQVINPDVYQ